MLKRTVNGFSMNIRVDGPGDAPWVIFSHSVTTDLSMWDDQAAALSKRYRVLRYDTRGHGLSAAPQGPYDFDTLVTDVVALMDDQDIEEACFVGLSLGGMTGLGLGIHHPDRFAGIVVCNARADAPEGYGAAWDERIALARSKGMDALVQPTLERWFTEDFRNSQGDVLARVGAMIRDTDPDGYIACAEALKRLDYLPRVKDMKVPVLLVAGAQDAGAPEPVMRALHEAIPASEYAVLDPAGHISNLEQPERFNTAIADFLDRHQPG